MNSFNRIKSNSYILDIHVFWSTRYISQYILKVHVLLYIVEKNPCKFGKPFASNGDALPCGGPIGIRCPAAFECQSGSNPLHSVCCPSMLTGIENCFGDT